MPQIALLVGFAVLTALQLGWLPPFRHAWAFNFWQYLSSPAGYALMALALAACFEPVQRGIVVACERTGGLLDRLPRVARDVALVAGVSTVFWLFRERDLFGDSLLFILSAQKSEQLFHFPDLGSSFLLMGSGRLAEAAGFDLATGVRLAVCLAGGLTFLALGRAFERLAPERAIAPWIAALVLSGGILRIFAGHIEVYAYLYLALSLHLRIAVDYLDGRRGATAFALSIGAVVWVHMCGLFLLPAMALALRRGEAKTSNTAWLAGVARATAIAALPSLVFLGLVFAFAGAGGLSHAIEAALGILGQTEGEHVVRRWVKLPFIATRPPGLGVEYTLFSPSHLKYLVNSFYLMTPFALPTLAFGLVARRGAFLADERRVYLLAALVPSLVYAAGLRPLWGPFDWDLFTIVGFLLAVLGALVLVDLAKEAKPGEGALPARDPRLLLAGCIALQLLFVAGPFLRIGVSVENEAGPFVAGGFYSEIHKGGKPGDHGRITPWL